VANKIQDNILWLVNRYPKVKDNYNLLVTSYWYVFEDAKTFQDTEKCTSAESITRAFRKLVSEGLVTLNKDVEQMRNEREVEYRDKYKRK
jgi:hypothetical protein